MARARTWLVAAGILLAVLAGALGLVAPWLVRRVVAPIARLRTTQGEFEEWTRERGWREPASPELSAARLDTFLALRRDLIALEAKAEELQRAVPEGTRPGIGQVAGIVEGVGDLVSGQLEAHRRHDMTRAEYLYIRRLVYRTWLGGLSARGEDPAARGRAASEIETAAAAEPNGATRARLERIAAELRARTPAAPEGIPPELHRLLSERAAEIETLADGEPGPLRRRRPREP